MYNEKIIKNINIKELHRYKMNVLNATELYTLFKEVMCTVSSWSTSCYILPFYIGHIAYICGYIDFVLSIYLSAF